MKVINYFLPMRDNMGRNTYEARKDFMARALDLAGGWTSLGTTTGAWKGDDGVTYLDECEVIAIADDDPGTHEKLVQWFWAFFPDQLALYASEGRAHILNRPSPVTKA